MALPTSNAPRTPTCLQGVWSSIITLDVNHAGDRAGQWSLRVNDQFRICFRWMGSDAEDVEIVDYH